MTSPILKFQPNGLKQAQLAARKPIVQPNLTENLRYVKFQRMIANRQTRMTLLGEVADILGGCQFRRKLEHDPNGSAYVLQPGNVSGGPIQYESLYRVDGEGIPDRYFARPSDLALLVRSRSNPVVSVGMAPLPLIISNYFLIIRPKLDLALPGFLCWCLKQKVSKRIFWREQQGTTVPMVSSSVVKSIPIPLPMIEHQEKIIELNDLLQTEERLLAQIAVKRHQLINSHINQTLGV